MAVPKQLSQITILRTGYPDPGKAIFQQQLQQKFGIEAIGFLVADALFLIVYSGRGADILMKSSGVPGGRWCPELSDNIFVWRGPNYGISPLA